VTYKGYILLLHNVVIASGVTVRLEAVGHIDLNLDLDQ